MEIRVENARPGQIYDGRQIIAVDVDQPFVGLTMSRATGGGRYTFSYGTPIWVEWAIQEGDVIDAQVSDVGNGLPAPVQRPLLPYNDGLDDIFGPRQMLKVGRS